MRSRGTKTTKNKSKLLSSSSYRRNLDQMKLLISDAEFQGIVRGAREYINIPADIGLKGEDANQQWVDYMDKKSDEIMNSQRFIDQELKIKNKIRDIGLKMTRKQMNLFYDQIPWNYLWNRVDFIIEKFRLPIHYKDYIQDYITFGKIDAPSHNYEGGLYPAGVSSKEARYIPLKVYTRLTQDELDELSRYIKYKGKDLPQYQLLNNIERDLKIEEWLANSERFDEVEQVLYKTTSSEIAKNLLGSSKKKDQVRDIKRNFRELKDRRLGRGKD